MGHWMISALSLASITVVRKVGLSFVQKLNLVEMVLLRFAQCPEKSHVLKFSEVLSLTWLRTGVDA